VADAKHQGRQQNHSIQVAFYSHSIARDLHLPELNPMDVLWAALLHNIGLTAVPVEDLQLDFDIRPELSPLYRRHPHISAGLIDDIPELAHLAPIIAAHHEHYDGSGFPLGLKGGRIPTAAQIIAMADVYQWIAGSSIHGNELHDQALSFIEKGKNTLFDPGLADRALSIFGTLGRRDNTWLQDLSNVHAFFNAQQPDEDVPQEQIPAKDKASDTLTLFPRQWYLIRLSNNLKIVSGGEEFSTLAGIRGCHHLDQALTDSVYGKLQNKLCLLSPDKTLTLSLHSRSGKTLEMIFARQKNGYDLLARGINTAPIFQQTSSVYYRNFINNPEPELLLDNQSLIKEVNTAFLNCFQIPREVLLKSTITGLFEPFLSPRKFLELQLFFRHQEAESWSDEFTFTTGTKDHLSIAAALYRIGGQECEQTTYLCRINNITERKKIEQEIIQRDNELQAIVHNTTGMTGEGFFKALLYQFMMLTKAAIGMVAELTDNNQALLPHVFRKGHQFQPPPDKFDLHGSPCQLTDRRGEVYFPRRLREFFPANALLQKENINSYWGLPLRKEDGIIIGVLSLYSSRPILHSKNMQAIARIFQARIAGELARLQTERVLLEKDRQLERQNSELTRMNQLKSDMIAITSHDLKAPLSAIIGYASLLEEHSSTMNKDKTLHYIRRIQNEGQKQLTFINKLLDLYRIESGAIELSLEPYRLDTLLASCLSSLREPARAREISFSLAINGPATALSIDHLRIGQVLNNLLSNAIKFSPEKGKISVSYEQNKEHVTIHILDQGPGINEQEISHIFDRYYMGRTDFKIRPEGSGLGLYIVRNIVELHGGCVSARNLSAGGSCFTVQLPTTPTAPTTIST
jgi:signal transduction histidine kinase/PAS domain-containing protein